MGATNTYKLQDNANKKKNLKIKASTCHATILWSLKYADKYLIYVDKHMFNGNIKDAWVW